VSATLALAVAGLAGSAVVRYGPLTQPWGYLFLTLAALGTVGTTLLFVMRAHGIDD
jgi:hypothetical protein